MGIYSKNRIDFYHIYKILYSRQISRPQGVCRNFSRGSRKIFKITIETTKESRVKGVQLPLLSPCGHSCPLSLGHIHGNIDNPGHIVMFYFEHRSPWYTYLIIYLVSTSQRIAIYL